MTPQPEADVFHAGEQELQRLAGSRERLAALGARVVQAQLQPMHRAVFEDSPLLALAVCDDAGQPWAGLLCGAGGGFAHAPDPLHLRVDALPAACDPVAPWLREQAWVGLLGIDPATRRRTRANGRIVAVDARGFTLRVAQSFGNCPRYIHARQALAREPAPPGAARHAERLHGAAAELVRRADTLFIASCAAVGQPGGGADASHRGGPPGFLRLHADGGTLDCPDYAGNRYFNTLGNLLVQPRAGLVFADFDSGDMVQVAARAEIVDDARVLAGFDGAERVLRLRIGQVVHRPGAMPLRWQPA